MGKSKAGKARWEREKAESLAVKELSGPWTRVGAGAVVQSPERASAEALSLNCAQCI